MRGVSRWRRCPSPAFYYYYYTSIVDGPSADDRADLVRIAITCRAKAAWPSN